MAEYKTYIDTDFTSGDSPVVIDLEGDLGVAPKNFVIFIGKAEIDVELSYDGTTYGDIFQFPPDKKIRFQGIKAKKIRLTHSGVDSAYGAVALPIGETIDITSIAELIAIPSATTAKVTANSSTSVLLLAANTARRGFIVSSPDVNNFWLKLQAASVDDLKEGIYLANADMDPWVWNNTKYIYTGEISIIAATDNPVIHVIEF